MRPVRSMSSLLDVVRSGLVGAAVMGVALGVLCGGSCYVAACSGDCCDPGDRCGDDGSPPPPPPPPGPERDGGFGLAGFALVRADLAGFHPVAAIVPAGGPAILWPAMGAVGPAPAADALAFTARVLRANPAFFELPSFAGELFPAGVRTTAEGSLSVRWSQARAGSPGRVVFHLDAQGRITSIENGTRLLPAPF